MRLGVQASAVQLSNVHWVNRTLCAVDATNDVTAHSSMQGIVDAMGCVAHLRSHVPPCTPSRFGRSRVHSFEPPPPPAHTHTQHATHPLAERIRREGCDASHADRWCVFLHDAPSDMLHKCIDVEMVTDKYLSHSEVLFCVCSVR